MKEMVKYELFYKKNENTPVAKIFGKVSPKIAADITKLLIDIDFKDFPNFIKDGILRYREKLDRNRNRLHLPLFELCQKYFKEKNELNKKKESVFPAPFLREFTPVLF